MLPSSSKDQLCNPLSALHWRWLVAVLVYWDFMLGVYFFVLPPSSVALCVPHTSSTVCVLLQLAVCFSVLWDILVLDADLWLRK
jgi:hypothetical protein